ncbi:hypothetical protein [Variovorax sp. PBL-E5]|uniref:hypothetical protein n=1 Tax=Variovorax sp. PBL-E5 TaxID=434014 RepID=UPI001319710F|nr:hypothetical protein [Variovorax sp. PBL-E5]VTU22089.1 hypothetical protein E5CHR_01319 [Variovorax sp. PBL-E5]
MPMELLHRLANARLPSPIASRDEIEKLRRLDAAGHVKALIPAPHFDCDDCLRQDSATVFEITPRGLRALNRKWLTPTGDEPHCDTVRRVPWPGAKPARRSLYE